MLKPRTHAQFCCGVDELAAIEVVADAGEGASAAGGISAGAAAAGAGIAAGVGAGIASTAGGAAAPPVGSAASPTGPSTSADPGGSASTPKSSFFGNAVKSSLAGSVASFGLQKVFGPGSRGVNIPPPPGAAMIDPEGAQAAAQLRQRQASAGGLNSTITGAGLAPTSATAGGKQLLGQ